MDIMLVDDDKLIRDDIKAFFEWEKQGFSIVHEAINGSEALLWLEKHQVDLILTDISMPRCNGIEMIKSLKEHGFTGELIVMSNYDDFNYVRDAMRMGAFDYCLKYKMTPEGLLALLQKAAEALKRKREVHSTSASRTRGELLEDALAGRMDELNEAVASGLLAPAYSLIYAKGAERQQIPLQEMRALNKGGMNVLRVPSEGLVIAMPFEKNDVGKESPYLPQTRIMMQRLFARQILVIAPGRTPPQQFSARLAEMRRSASQHFYQENFMILNDPFAVWAEMLPAPQKRQLETELYCAAETLNRERFDRAEASAIQAFLDCRLHPRSACAFFENILSRICQMFDLSEKDISFSADTVHSLSALHAALAIWKRGFFIIPIATSKEEIVRAVHFIYANYARELSLDEVSQTVFLSKNHFCTLFRKEVGENFVSFLQKLRMEKAKIFLRDYHYRVQEVAAAVGFDNSRYFSMVFHKYTGMSPTQYRERTS